MAKASFERLLEARDARRGKAEDRFLTRLERLTVQAESLVGELNREGNTVWYVSLTDQKGNLTGKIKESHCFSDLVAYLIRNHYVG